MLRFSRVLASPVSTSTFVICLSLALSSPSPRHRSPLLAALAFAVSSTSPHPISPSLSLPPPAVFFIFIFYPLLSCWLCAPVCPSFKVRFMCLFHLHLQFRQFAIQCFACNIVPAGTACLLHIWIRSSVCHTVPPPFITIFHRPSNS